MRSIPLTREKLSCLQDGEWLNEEVINAWLEAGVLQQAAPSSLASMHPTSRRPRLHIPLTYFYSRLSNDGRGYDYAGVQRWFRKVDLFPSHNHGEGDGSDGGRADCCVDAVLVPLHLGRSHWALMAIDLGAKRFRYFDSLHPSKLEAERHANLLWRWLCDEADRRGYSGLRGLASERTAGAVAVASRDGAASAEALPAGRKKLQRRKPYNPTFAGEAPPAADAGFLLFTDKHGESYAAESGTDASAGRKQQRRREQRVARGRDATNSGGYQGSAAPLKLAGWTVEAVAAAPRQHNGYDCGVFMLMFARSIAMSPVSAQGLQIHAQGWRWGQADMPLIRQRILADLVA